MASINFILRVYRMFCRLLEKEVKVPFQLMVIKSISMPAGVYLLKKKMLLENLYKQNEWLGIL